MELIFRSVIMKWEVRFCMELFVYTSSSTGLLEEFSHGVELNQEETAEVVWTALIQVGSWESSYQAHPTRWRTWSRPRTCWGPNGAEVLKGTWQV